MGRRTARPGEPSRADIERPVGLRFKHLGGFVDELAANVSTGGMFIRTARPHPVGSVFEFELRPASDRPHIAGKAQVVWVRRQRAGEDVDRPAGMGVRFVELDDESRRDIAELVAVQSATGGTPAETGSPEDDPAVVVSTAGAEASAADPPAGAGRPAPASTTPPPPRGRAAAAATDRRGWRPAYVVLVALLVAAFAFVLAQRPPAESPAESPAEPPAESPAESPDSTPQAAAEPSAAPPPAGEPAAAAPRRAGPSRAVEAWAEAWSEQRVEDYLAAYSPRFVPGDGLDRQSWERQRRARLLAPGAIAVGLAFIEVEEVGAGRSRVRFVQAYESDSYRDVVRKVLELENGADGWKIVRETVEP